MQRNASRCAVSVSYPIDVIEKENQLGKTSHSNTDTSDA